MIFHFSFKMFSPSTEIAAMTLETQFPPLTWTDIYVSSPPLKKRAVKLMNCDPHHFAQSNTTLTSFSDHIWGQSSHHSFNDNIVIVVLDENSTMASPTTVSAPIEETSEMKINSTLLSYVDSLYNASEENAGGDSDSGDELSRANKKNFGDNITNLLTVWILENQSNPYPNQSEKDRLADLSGLSVQQVTDWLANVRKRHLFPVIRY